MALVRVVLIKHHAKTIIRTLLLCLWLWLATEVLFFLYANWLSARVSAPQLAASPFVLYLAIRNFVRTARRGY